MITIKATIEEMAERIIASMSDMIHDAIKDNSPLEVTGTMEEAQDILAVFARRDKNGIRQLFEDGNTFRLLNQNDIKLIEKSDEGTALYGLEGRGFEDYEVRVYDGDKLLLVVIYDEINY